MPEANQEFIRIVEAQGRQPVGIPVLLFTDATLATTPNATPDSPDESEQSNVVQRAAAELGFDLTEVDLFSTRTYLLQSAAGRLTAGE